jgi:CRISPR-associated protein Csx3
MSTYNIVSSSVSTSSGHATMLKVSFGTPAQNDVIVKDASASLEALALTGGPLVLVNGPASLPVAMVLCHGLCHKFGAVGCFDPKMAGYVVAVSHRPDLGVGAIVTTV